MSDRAMNEESPGPKESEEINLLDIAAVPFLYWRFIIGFTLACVVLVLLISVFQDKKYTASTIILPSNQGMGESERLARFAAALPVDLAALGAVTEIQTIEAVLRSRSIKDSIVHRERLLQKWEMESMDRARKRLENVTNFEENDGSIEIRVRNSDPELAAAIANAYPEVLNRITAEMSAQFAQEKVDFLRNQLQETRRELESVEDRLAEFQRMHGAPQVEEQARQTVEAASQLQLLIIEKEIALAQERRFSTEQNPRIRQLASELTALRGELRDLTTGRPGTTSQGEVFVPLREAPDLGLGYLRLYREFQEQEQVYGAMMAALAESRIAASQELPVVSVVDTAVVPTLPSEPRIPRRVVGAIVMGLFLSLLLAFGMEWMRSMRMESDSRRFFDAWARFVHDARSMVGFFRHGPR
jgi:uncharacterized protein involved in exopolysaccharide biosynthesis